LGRSLETELEEYQGNKMTQHKWAKEIHAWADGAEIEQSLENASGWTGWHIVVTPTFYTSGAEFRIKPQPKEPQYMYVYRCTADSEFRLHEDGNMEGSRWKLKGKIKLEVDDEKS